MGMSEGMDFDEAGRRRIGAVVQFSMDYQGLTGVAIDKGERLSRAGRRITRATVVRVKRGDQVSVTMLRGLGDVLSLPTDFLIHVGAGDTNRIAVSRRAAEDGDPELIEYALALVRQDAADQRRRPAPAKSRATTGGTGRVTGRSVTR